MEAPAPIPDSANELARQIVDAALSVHRALGPGLLESVYEICLAHELVQRGVQVERQKEVPIEYRGIRLQGGLKLDLLVEGQVLVELKSVEALAAIHEAQTLTYLTLARLRLALLINFNVPRIEEGVRRIVL